METKGHLRLRAYLKRHKLTGPRLAEQAGLSPVQVCHLVVGRRGASLRVAVALERATGGAIEPRAWTEPASQVGSPSDDKQLRLA